MMKKELRDDVVHRAILRAQMVCAGMCEDGTMPFGANLFCRVMWPKAHNDEPFLFVGPKPDTVRHVDALSEQAATRLGETVANFGAKGCRTGMNSSRVSCSPR